MYRNGVEGDAVDGDDAARGLPDHRPDPLGRFVRAQDLIGKDFRFKTFWQRS